MVARFTDSFIIHKVRRSHSWNLLYVMNEIHNAIKNVLGF